MEQRLGALDDGLLFCDHEPIHLLGALQPTGFLLSVNADWLIVRASENARAYLGIDHADLLGRPLVDTISCSA